MKILKIYCDDKLMTWQNEGPDSSAERYAVSVLRTFEGSVKDTLAWLDDKCAAEAKKWLIGNLDRIEIVSWSNEFSQFFESEDKIADFLAGNKEMEWEVLREDLNRLYESMCDLYFRAYTYNLDDEEFLRLYTGTFGGFPVRNQAEWQQVLRTLAVPEDVLRWCSKAAKHTSRKKLGLE